MGDGDGGAAASSTKKNFIDQFFGLEFDTTYLLRSGRLILSNSVNILFIYSFIHCVYAFLFNSFMWRMKCTESEDEEPVKGTENHLQLSCFINQEVKYLATGIRLVSNSPSDCSAASVNIILLFL